MPMMSTLSFSFLFLLCLSTNTFNVVFAKSILEMPFEIQSVSSLLQRDGCKSFYNLLSTSSEAIGYFLSNAPGGVTVFCPSDDAVTTFAPIYKNLTGDQKMSLLLYHGVPVYFSMEMLRSSNGLMNTLATHGNNRFDFILQNDGNDVKLNTKVVTATITGTVVDDYEPLAVYKIDKVLMPRELFKGVVAEEPAEAPMNSMDIDEPARLDSSSDDYSIGEGPTPQVDQNFTSSLLRDGCKSFYDLLSTSSEAIGYFLSNADRGVTVFCPSDDAITAFAPIYKNLTGDQKTSLLLYHGVPFYFSMEMLRSSNGWMNTLATDGNNRYDFVVQNDGSDVKLYTKVVTATITGTVVDDYGPVAVYKIDQVLMPRELFKAITVEQAGEPAQAPKAAISMDAEAPYSSDYYGDLPEYQMANTGGRVVASMVMALFLVVTFIL